MIRKCKVGTAAILLILTACQAATPDATEFSPTSETTPAARFETESPPRTIELTPLDESIRPSVTPTSARLPFSPQLMAQFENADMRNPELSPDGQFLVLEMNGLPYLYHAATLQQWWAGQFTGHVTWFANGQHVAIGSMVYDILTGAQVAVLPVEASHTSWSSDGTLAATFDSRGMMVVWDGQSGLQIWTIPRPTDVTWFGDIDEYWLEIDFSPENDKIAVQYTYGLSGSDLRVHIFEARTGEVITRLEGVEFAYFAAISWSPDNRHLATYNCCGMGQRGFGVWDVDTGEVITTGRSYTLEWSPDGSLFAVGVNRGVVVQRTQSGEIVLTMNYPVFNATRIRWSRDGTLLAADNVDGSSSVAIWSVEDSRSYYLLKDARELIGFGSDNQTLIAGLGRFYTIAVWDLDVQSP